MEMKYSAEPLRICFALLILGSACCVHEADAKQFRSEDTRTEKLSNRKFFPYNSYLLLTIKEISTHKEYMYHGDKAKLDVVVLIEAMLRRGDMYGDPKKDTGFRKGGTVTFVIDDPELLAPLKRGSDQLVGTRNVWGIDFWRIGTGFYHLDKIYEPFPSHKFTSQDLERLKAQLVEKG